MKKFSFFPLLALISLTIFELKAPHKRNPQTRRTKRHLQNLAKAADRAALAKKEDTQRKTEAAQEDVKQRNEVAPAVKDCLYEKKPKIPNKKLKPEDYQRLSEERYGTVARYIDHDYPEGEQMRRLLSEGVDSVRDPENNSTVLWNAVAKDKPYTLRFCLENDADVNAADKYGTTPLFEATAYFLQVSRATTENIKTLLAHHANPHIKDLQGRNVFKFLQQHINWVKKEMEKGKSVDWNLKIKKVSELRELFDKHLANNK